MDASHEATFEHCAPRLARTVRRGARAAFVVRALEIVAVGAVAGALTASIALVTSPQATVAEVVAVASIAGLSTGAAFLRERRPAARAFVRALDEVLLARGGLTTAVDALDARPASPLARLLVLSIEPRVDRAACARAVRPSAVLLLAGPLCAAALVFLALEARGEARDEARALTREAGAARHLDRAAQSLDRVAQALDRVAQAVRGAARQARSSSSASPDARSLIASLESVAERLERANPRDLPARAEISALDGAIVAALGQAADPDLGRALESARSALRDLDGLDAHATPAARADSRPNRRPGGAAPRVGEAGPVGAAGSGASAPSLGVASGAPDGRMSAPPVSRTAPTPPSPHAAARASNSEVAVGSPPWWDPIHDAVVERFVEARRTGRRP